MEEFGKLLGNRKHFSEGAIKRAVRYTGKVLQEEQLGLLLDYVIWFLHLKGDEYLLGSRF